MMLSAIVVLCTGLPKYPPDTVCTAKIATYPKNYTQSRVKRIRAKVFKGNKQNAQLLTAC